MYETFRNVCSKLVTKNPSPPSTPTWNSSCYCSFYSQYKTSGILGSPSISSKFGNLSAFNQNQSGLLSGVARRYYYVERNQVYHFRPRGYYAYRRWFRDPRIVFIVVVVGSGVAITIYYGNLEVVPYTKRKHFVLLSRNMEKRIGESQFNQMKNAFKGKILPPLHPESIRVRLIAKDIIEALQRGLSLEHVWSEPSYAWEVDALFEQAEEEALKAFRMGLEETVPDKWKGDEGGLDDKWVKKSRKKSEKQGFKPATQHLEGLNWEVLVVDEPVVNAFCLPGGKIVVFTGLLKHFRTDPEIATVLGHEVGHAVARHSAEMLTKSMWLVLIELVLFQFITPDLVVAMSSLLLRLPFSRKMEIEADYIGLLLMASAGYDPRVAPKVYEKLGKVTGDSALRDYLSTHPSGKTRAQLLARAEVMEEALSIYRETIAGRGIEGFL